MKLKRFTGANTHAALQQVRRVLGDEAVILETETVPGGVVITAAVDVEAVAASRVETLSTAARALAASVYGTAASAAGGNDAAHRDALERSLARQGVDGILAAALLRAVDGAGTSVSEALGRVLARQSGTDQLAAVECFIGPPGDGKTTTVVKLAAQARQRGARVALVSTDTHRVGAAAELEVYGRALGIQTARATSGFELAEIVRRFEVCDHVLVDTAGVAPDETSARDELARLVDGLPRGTGCTLVASAGYGAVAAARVWNTFAALAPSGSIITKRDMAPGAPLVAQMWRAAVPISHFTTGRRIPDDIEPATPVRLAESLLAA
jgi:flagellar biosynthesis protein FlhF